MKSSVNQRLTEASKWAPGIPSATSRQALFHPAALLGRASGDAGEKNEPVQATGVGQGNALGDESSQGVAREVAGSDTEMIHHGDDVADEIVDVIGAGRLARGAVAPEVQANGAEPVAQAGHHLIPGIQGRTNTMNEHEIGPLALLANTRRGTPPLSIVCCIKGPIRKCCFR